jgi:oligopeptide transport system substrate-binding protein
VDELLEMAATELDEDRSLELYRQIEQMLVDDAACLPLWFAQSYVLVRPYVTGYVLSPNGIASLNLVSIAD